VEGKQQNRSRGSSATLRRPTWMALSKQPQPSKKRNSKPYCPVQSVLYQSCIPRHHPFARERCPRYGLDGTTDAQHQPPRLASSARPSHEGSRPYIHKRMSEGTEKSPRVLEVYYPPNICRYTHSLALILIMQRINIPVFLCLHCFKSSVLRT